MIRTLLNIVGDYNIDIIPRDYEILVLDTILLNIVEEGTNLKDTDIVCTASLSGNYINVSFNTSIFKEDCFYTINITKNGNLWFRDKVYVATQLDKTKTYTLNENKYQENTNSDTEYITL